MEKDYYKLTFLQSNDAIMISEYQENSLINTIIDVNPAWERLVGYKREDIIGMTTGFLFIDNSVQFAEHARELWDTKHTIHNIVFKDKSGVVRQHEISSHLLFLDDKWICISVGRDNSEQKYLHDLRLSLYQKEHELCEQLQQSDNQRIEFMRALIHELKSPLTPMMSMSGLLAEVLDNQYKEYAINLNASTAFLVSRINDLYDLTRCEVNTLSLKKIWVNLDELLSDVESIEHGHYLTKGMKLEIHPDIPNIQFYADEDRVKQVLINLVNNAIEHNPPGCTIKIGAIVKDKILTISVADDGIGISEADQIAIFKPYMKKTSNSLGLGLALSAKIIELHKGTICLESQIGKGTTIIIKLPLDGSEMPTP
ncbi:HAMP domain-containing sensor histidine kinase [Dehalococcoides mccartyi]|jgi:PAS domain S-box-containing protein|uniref:PAS domain-containing sensor histidine kinase n=1 Tax=Dehalococcoides mccartyi TaxID=61435 RepID=UPI0003C8126A|nr:HAMP domain-containing sensor histidine kinase [Dehalococcoides mccartyi]AHB12907.1 sensor histidine kinase [Dehalococcoides mccartyi GY50]